MGITRLRGLVYGLFFLASSVYSLSGCSTMSAGKAYTLCKVDRDRSLIEARKAVRASEPDAVSDKLDTMIEPGKGCLGVVLNSGFVRYLDEVDRPEVAIFVRTIVRDPARAESALVWQKVYLSSEDEKAHIALNRNSDFPKADITLLPSIEYGGEEIEIQVRIIELDQEDNVRTRELVNAAASAAVGFVPEYAAAVSVFQVVLTFLTVNNVDDIEFCFDLQISPPQPQGPAQRRALDGADSEAHDLVLQPRVANYAIIKTEHQERLVMPDGYLAFAGESIQYTLAQLLRLGTLNILNWGMMDRLVELLETGDRDFSPDRGDRYSRLFGEPFATDTLSWAQPQFRNDGTLWLDASFLSHIPAQFQYVNGGLHVRRPMSDEKREWLEEEEAARMHSAQAARLRSEAEAVTTNADLARQSMRDAKARAVMAAEVPTGTSASDRLSAYLEEEAAREGRMAREAQGKAAKLRDEAEVPSKYRSESTEQTQRDDLLPFRDQTWITFSVIAPPEGESFDELVKLSGTQKSIDDLGIRTAQLSGKEFGSALKEVTAAIEVLAFERQARRGVGKEINRATSHTALDEAERKIAEQQRENVEDPDLDETARAAKRRVLDAQLEKLRAKRRELEANQPLVVMPRFLDAGSSGAPVTVTVSLRTPAGSTLSADRKLVVLAPETARADATVLTAVSAQITTATASLANATITPVPLGRYTLTVQHEGRTIVTQPLYVFRKAQINAVSVSSVPMTRDVPWTPTASMEIRGVGFALATHVEVTYTTSRSPTERVSTLRIEAPSSLSDELIALPNDSAVDRYVRRVRILTPQGVPSAEKSLQ